MSRLLTKLTNFKLPKLPQLHVDKVIYLVEDPSNSGELKLRDEGIPPDQGMFGVLWLNGIRVLVQHVEKLPYRPTVNLEGKSYAIVRPVPTLSEKKEGGLFTVVAETSHFLVQIVKILPPIDTLTSSSNEPGIGFTIVSPPAAPITDSAPTPAIAPILPPQSIGDTSDGHQTTTQNPLSISTQLRSPDSSNIRPKPKDLSRRVKPPPISPIEVAITHEITTTVDPIPDLNKSLPSLPIEDRAQTPAPNPIDAYRSLPRTALPVGAYNDTSTPHPQTQSHSKPLVKGQRTQSLSESGLSKHATRNTVSHGRTSSMSRPQKPQWHRSTPLGTSPLRNEVIPRSSPDSSPEVALPPTRPTKMEGLNLRNFPSSLTPSSVEDMEDDFNAQREAIVGLRKFSSPSPSSPAARTTSSQGTKDSKHSHSRILVAIPSTRTPNPRRHIPLHGDGSPSHNHVPEKNGSERYSKPSALRAGSGSGSSQRPLGLGLDLSGQLSRIEIAQGPDPPNATPGPSSSPSPSPGGHYPRHHRRAGSVRVSSASPN